MTPIRQLRRGERAETVAALVGWTVLVTINPGRKNGDPLYPIVGKLVCVATSGANGTVGEILVVATPTRVLWYSLAIVESIEVRDT